MDNDRLLIINLFYYFTKLLVYLHMYEYTKVKYHSLALFIGNDKMYEL